jgi:hypothetical protein
MGDSEAIIYGSDECSESKAMAQLLTDLGVQFRFRLVNRDATAQRAPHHRAGFRPDPDSAALRLGRLLGASCN